MNVNEKIRKTIDENPDDFNINWYDSANPVLLKKPITLDEAKKYYRILIEISYRNGRGNEFLYEIHTIKNNWMEYYQQGDGGDIESECYVTEGLRDINDAIMKKRTPFDNVRMKDVKFIEVYGVPYPSQEEFFDDYYKEWLAKNTHKGYNTAPKRKIGLHQLENSVRKMW